MKQTATTVVRRTPEQIWPIISDPAALADLNPSMGTAEPLDESDPQIGSAYRVTGSIGGHGGEGETEIVEFEPNSLICLKYTGGQFKSGGYALVSFFLDPHPEGTELTMEVDLTPAKLPVWATLLLKAVPVFSDKAIGEMVDALGARLEEVT